MTNNIPAFSCTRSFVSQDENTSKTLYNEALQYLERKIMIIIFIL